MKKERIEFIITGVAIVFFILLLANTLSQRKRPEIPPPPASKSASVEEGRPMILPEGPKPQIETRYGGWGRDPFVLKAKVEEYGGMVLSGIIWDEGEPYAIINGEVVGQGDEVSDHTVIEIRKDSVVLEKEKERLTLSLWQ